MSCAENRVEGVFTLGPICYAKRHVGRKEGGHKFNNDHSDWLHRHIPLVKILHTVGGHNWRINVSCRGGEVSASVHFGIVQETRWLARPLNTWRWKKVVAAFRLLTSATRTVQGISWQSVYANLRYGGCIGVSTPERGWERISVAKNRTLEKKEDLCLTGCFV